MRFASARISMMILSATGTWEEWPGDRQSLGYRRSDPDFHFDSFERTCQSGDAYYLMTDGLLDQAGGPRGFGLGRTRLWELLASQQGQSMAYQREAIQAALESYQEGRPQRDDIVLIGFRI
jgi:serine phosphatase RsbU (regulator of sigma subunit)